MKRWLWLLLIPTLVQAAIVHPVPVDPEGIESVALRNGVYPDVLYDGIILQKVDAANPTTSYADQTTVTCGYGATGPGTDDVRMLFKVDLSAIPSAAVVKRARLRFALASYTGYAATTTYDLMQLHRILIPWTSSATWNNRGTSPDSAWGTAGCEDIALSIPNGTTAFGTTVSGTAPSVAHLGQSGYQVATAAWNPTYKEEGGVRTFPSTDSLYSAAFCLSAGTAADRTELPDSYWFIRPRATSFTGACWFDIDITRLVQNWVDKSWANYGAMIFIEQIVSTSGNLLTINAPDHGTSALRPRVDIEYQYATSASGGGGGDDRTLGLY